MSTPKAIIAMGVLIALSAGGAIMLTNRYQVSQPFDPRMFTRFDRWFGRVEICSSYYDETTYCGAALSRRTQEGVDAANEAEYQKFLEYGYTQAQIANWPPHVLDVARNIVGNGGDKAALDNWIHKELSSK
jgi:hypothetical protein